AGVPAAAVQTVDQALAHPHTRHRGMLLEQGDYQGVGSPIKLSRTPATLRKLPPALAPAASQE
ncbi:CoA transferase, partial [Achromobacter sp. Bel]|uniref:CoA transferase n=1 Tax=Achromobacter sp. Bel TaxID=2727415 RepID=UPI0017F194A7